MQIVIEFYRIRDEDDAHAVIGREAVDASNLDDAITVARKLLLTLDMPQLPDAMAITDAAGVKLYSEALDAETTKQGRPPS